MQVAAQEWASCGGVSGAAGGRAENGLWAHQARVLALHERPGSLGRHLLGRLEQLISGERLAVCAQGAGKQRRDAKGDEDQLRTGRRALSELVLSKIRAVDHVEHIWPAAQEDVALGAMSDPRLDAATVDDIRLKRCLPVREQRPSGRRTRAADHITENGSKWATRPRSSPLRSRASSRASATRALESGSFSQ